LQTQLALLEKIQQIDIEIGRIEKEQERYPKEKGRLDTEMTQLRGEVDALNGAYEEILNQKAQLDNDLANWSEKISRHEERLKGISNDKQLKAVTKEKNTATKKKLELGKEIAKIDKLVEAKEAELAIIKGKLEEKLEEYEALDRELNEKDTEWKRFLDEKRSEREGCAGKIKPDVLRRYDQIKNKRHGIGMVLASDGTCQGCHMSIPPQLYIQLIQGSSDELIVCPHCHRILRHNREG